MASEMFPIMVGTGGHKAFVPRSMLDERQALKNHDQSLDRLAQRGGLSIGEAYAVARRQRWERIESKVAWAWFFEQAVLAEAVKA